MKRFALVLLLLAACSKKPSEDKAPTCAELADHILAVTQQAYPGHGDMGAGGNRQRTIEECEARKVPAEERRCIIAAKTMEAVGQCRRGSMKGSAK